MAMRSRNLDQDFGTMVSRPKPRPWLNELDCTRVSTRVLGLDITTLNECRPNKSFYEFEYIIKQSVQNCDPLKQQLKLVRHSQLQHQLQLIYPWQPQDQTKWQVWLCYLHPEFEVISPTASSVPQVGQGPTFKNSLRDGDYAYLMVVLSFIALWLVVIKIFFEFSVYLNRLRICYKRRCKI